MKRVLPAALVALLALAGAAVATDGFSTAGSEIAAGERSGGEAGYDIGADQTVVASGSTPAAGRWQLTVYRSEGIAHGGETLERRGMPCVLLGLLDPQVDPDQGGATSFCGEAGGRLVVSGMPVTGPNGQREVLLFGRGPGGARGVRLSSAEGVRATAHTHPLDDGTGDTAWVLAAPTQVERPTLEWTSGNSEPAGPPVDVSRWMRTR